MCKGNTEYLNHYLKSNTIDSDNASVYEIAFAFGHRSTAISLHQSSDMSNLQNAYSVFHEIAETLPQMCRFVVKIFSVQILVIGPVRPCIPYK
jgi:hypothetical protein